MKKLKTQWAGRWIVAWLVSCGLLASLAVQAASYRGVPGSSMKVAGTSSIHDWTVESKIISGTLDLGFDPANVKPGKVEAKAKVSIPVKTLKSYSSKMDEVMWDAMEANKYRRIQYTLKELVLKEKPAKAGDPLKFEAKGSLTVHGVTKEITMPVTMVFEGDKLKVSGQVALKMTDFKIKPPAPKLGLGLIKTGDEVKLTFTWVLSKVS